MTRPLNWISSAVAVLALTTSMTVAPAFAGNPQHGYNTHSRSGHQAYKQGYQKGAHTGYHRGSRHGSSYHGASHRGGHRGGYRGGYGGHYRGHYSRHHHGLGGTGAAILGVGLGLTTLAILSESRRSYDNDRTVVIDQRPITVVQEPTYNPSLPPARTASSANSCLQTREYQTTIVIGGVEREAYGTACLQPDGAWLQGPAQTVPDY